MAAGRFKREQKELEQDGFIKGLAGDPCDPPTTREVDRAAWVKGWNAGHDLTQKDIEEEDYSS
jgi:hypothetical protein